MTGPRVDRSTPQFLPGYEARLAEVEAMAVQECLDYIDLHNATQGRARLGRSPSDDAVRVEARRAVRKEFKNGAYYEPGASGYLIRYQFELRKAQRTGDTGRIAEVRAQFSRRDPIAVR